ncbi:MAG: MFS transporter [Candidatus Lokiarchaeota archaeon]|nr:MFS transporter [Candidatus Lokiarchaeota archaeon]
MNARLLTFYAGYFAVLFARASIFAYLPLSLMQYTNASMFAVGLNYAVPYIAQLTTMVYFGKLLDKGTSSRRYQSLVLLGFSAMAAQFTSFYIMGNGSPDAVQFVIVSVICNLLATAYVPAVKKFVSALNTSATQGSALSSIGVVESISFAAGSFIGGFMFQIVGMNVLFFVATITAASSLAMILIGRPFVLVDGIARERPPPVIPAGSTSTSPAQPGRHKVFIGFGEIAAFLVALNVSIGLFFPFFSPYMESLHGDASLIGISHAAACVLGAIMFKVMGRVLDKNHPHFPFLYGSLGYVVVFLIFIVTTNPIVAFLSWAIPVYPYFLGINYIVAIVTPLQRRGRAFSMVAIAQIASIAAGSIAGGVLLSMQGISFLVVLVIGMIGLCISLAIFVRAWLSRKNRKE